MYLFGYSLDNLSLMALTISTGFVVDDAIVVMENMCAPSRSGNEAFHAALKGAEEIGFTVLSISISLVAVFIPLLLMGGYRRPPLPRIRRHALFRPSRSRMVISLTTTPMMCAAPASRRADSRSMAACTGPARPLSVDCSPLYRRTLHWVLDHPVLTLMVLAFRSPSTWLVFIKIPKGFFPVQDTGVNLRRPARTARRLASPRSTIRFSQSRAVIKNDPGVANVVAFTGGGPQTRATSTSRSSHWTTASRVLPRSSPAFARNCIVFGPPRPFCSRHRICASVAAAAMPCINTHFSPTTGRI